jgi:hypothetical protein
MLNVGIFLKSVNSENLIHTLTCFANGVYRYENDNPIMFHGTKYEPCDVAVFFGSWKDRPDAHHVLKKDIVLKAKNFICIETPLLGRGPVKDVLEDTSYRIGVNGFLRDSGNFNNKNSPSDRWDIIRKKFNLELKPWNNNQEGPIVIVLQLPGDASLRGCNISQWAFSTAEKIRELTDRKIVVRTPQLDRVYDREWIEKLSKITDVVFQKGTKENLIPTLEQAYCTVTYTSGMGIESVLNGCPTVACNPGNFAFSISSQSVLEINNLKREDRQQWVQDLAYCQWDLDEMNMGLVWKHLKGVIINGLG